MQSKPSVLKSSTTVFEETISETRTEDRTRLRLSVESGLFLLLLGVIILIRVNNVNYNTLFVDEAIYATVGEEALSGVFTQSATTWMYGSYLYPFLAAITSHLGGVVGLRVFSALLITAASVIVFLTTLRLFGQKAALWAMLVFGLTGGSINLGQLAVYDSLAVPLLALALYFIALAALDADRKESYFLLAAAVSFSLSAISKYITILYLPALILVAFTLYFFRGRSLLRLIVMFLIPTLAILGIYGWRYSSDLLLLFSHEGGVYSFQSSSSWIIAKVVWQEIGVAVLLAMIGTFFLPRLSFDSLHFGDRSAMFLAAMLGPLLLLSMLAAPIYHLVNANIGSMWKHLVYSLIFLSPLAGRGVSLIVWKTRPRSGRRGVYYPVLGAVITMIGLVWFIDHSLDQNWWIQRSWPNATGVIEYLRSEELSQEDRILAEGAQIYEYYFDFGVADRDIWLSTWYLEYGGMQGVEAMRAAINDHWFDFVVLDGYYNPAATPELIAALIQAGYSLGYQEAQTLSSGSNIDMRVYLAPERAVRTERASKIH